MSPLCMCALQLYVLCLVHDLINEVQMILIIIIIRLLSILTLADLSWFSDGKSSHSPSNLLTVVLLIPFVVLIMVIQQAA